MEYLDFKEISKIPFIYLLDWLNVPYIDHKTEIKGQTDIFKFIVNKDKNLFFSPDNDSIKGSVINFLAQHRSITLRQAASELKQVFLPKPNEEKKLPDYELDHIHPFLTARGISLETAHFFDVGYCKHGIMKGKIAIPIHDAQGNKVAYIGRNIKDEKNKYFFPKAYRHIYLFNWHRVNTNYVILAVSPFDVMHIYQMGIKFVCGLLSHTMTKEQQELLTPFKKILLLHPKPQNILQRLSNSAFVKAPSVNSVPELVKEDIINFFS